MTAAAHIQPLLAKIARLCNISFEVRNGSQVVFEAGPSLTCRPQEKNNGVLAARLAQGRAFQCQLEKPGLTVWGRPFRAPKSLLTWLLAYDSGPLNGTSPDEIMALLSQLVALVEDRQAVQAEIDAMAAVLEQNFEELALYGRMEKVIGAEAFSREELVKILKGILRALHADIVFMRFTGASEITATVGDKAPAQYRDDPQHFIAALLDRIPADALTLPENFFVVNHSARIPDFGELSDHSFRFLAARAVCNGKEYGWLGLVTFDFSTFFQRGQLRLLVTIASQVAMMAANSQLLQGLNQTVNRVKASQRQLHSATRNQLAAKPGVNDMTDRFINNEFNNMVNGIEQGQALLMRSAQMATMGQLAAQLSHEIKQPLTALDGVVQIAKLEKSDLKVRNHLETIEKTIDRMARLVRRFEAFSRPHLKQPARISINAIVKEVLELVTAQLNKDQIDPVTELDATLPAVWADAQGVQQVILNLMTNAIQAMQNGNGRRTLRVRTYVDEDHACVDVEDTGEGIAKELHTKIFEPYFTTKDSDKGTGLGLAMVKDIIEQQHGKIEVESRPGNGSRFTVKIPVVTDG